MRANLLPAALLAAILVPSASAAQEPPAAAAPAPAAEPVPPPSPPAPATKHPIEVSAFAGVYVFSSTNELGQNDNVVEPHSLAPSLDFGIRLGWMWNRRISFEGELALVPAHVEHHHEAAGTDDIFVLGLRAQAVVNLVNLPPVGRFMQKGGSLFALAGGGILAGSGSDGGAFFEDTDTLLHAGVGARLGIRRHWGFRIDARVLLPPAIDSEGLTTDFELLLGLYGTFIGPTPPAPAPAAP